MRAIEQIREQYLTEVEVANLFGVAPERIRDLRSAHKNGKLEFIPVSGVSAKEHLYHINDVLAFIESRKCAPFVANKDNSKSQTLSTYETKRDSFDEWAE
jgi:hypothetical protein